MRPVLLAILCALPLQAQTPVAERLLAALDLTRPDLAQVAALAKAGQPAAALERWRDQVLGGCARGTWASTVALYTCILSAGPKRHVELLWEPHARAVLAERPTSTSSTSPPGRPPETSRRRLVVDWSAPLGVGSSDSQRLDPAGTKP